MSGEPQTITLHRILVLNFHLRSQTAQLRLIAKRGAIKFRSFATAGSPLLASVLVFVIPR
jgi:hypothetical protein